MKKVLRIVLKPAVIALFAIVCSLFFTNEVKAGDLRFDVDGEGVRSISWTPKKTYYDYGENITVNVVLENGYMIKSYLNETNNDPKLNSFSFVYDDGPNNDATMIVNVQTMRFEGFDVTFKVKNGAWNDGTKQDKIKTVWRETGEDKALVLLAADVPAVGSKPDGGYREGSWSSPEPAPGIISSNVTYTYTYAPITVPEPQKDDDNGQTWKGPTLKVKKEDKGGEEEHSSKPAVFNPDTVEGFFMVNGQILPGVAMGKMKQGVAAQAVFNANRAVGWNETFTFNIAINGKVDYTLKNGTLTFIIPKEYQKAGRTFAVMALDKNGKAWTFADIDTNPSTLTANINVEGYAFALIYKD